MKEDSVLFVFYNLSKNNYWEYNRMPEDWRWTGKGFTRPFSPNKNRKKSRKIHYLKMKNNLMVQLKLLII